MSGQENVPISPPQVGTQGPSTVSSSMLNNRCQLNNYHATSLVSGSTSAVQDIWCFNQLSLSLLVTRFPPQFISGLNCTTFLSLVEAV